MKSTRTRAKNDVIGSRRSEPIILSDFLPQFYQGRVCKYASRWTSLSTPFQSASRGGHLPPPTLVPPLGRGDPVSLMFNLHLIQNIRIVNLTGETIRLKVLTLEQGFPRAPLDWSLYFRVPPTVISSPQQPSVYAKKLLINNVKDLC
ncbi:hypothetical protein AVEN_185351-1 [Araneus ventricosus]|uniref:Uncharacterized protein n=1 Tax=Araneus ventricosus TaxID=182803 RepID=A0A4Y2HR86_ARAVE|nr:hypothetical protein AVEN_185351-1 [Araneus ventricosus]